MKTFRPIVLCALTAVAGLTGSRAMVGSLGGEALQIVSYSGMMIADGIRQAGGDPDRLDLDAAKMLQVLELIEDEARRIAEENGTVLAIDGGTL